jgi:deoxyribonuclease-1
MRSIGIVLIFVATWAHAQVTLSTSTLNFGDVLTTADKELAVDVTNTTALPLVIDQVKLYNSDFVYTLANATIAPSSSQKVRVTFKPRHNVVYNSELILVLSDGSEHRIDILGNGRYDGTYYDATFDKSYQDLKDELKTILAANYTNLGYSGARDKMYGEIDNVGGKVTCVYTGRQATFNTRATATSNSFNCEHTWPQSLFNQNEPERADIHHLFSTDDNANNKRGSYPFGVVSNASWTEGGSKLGGGVFEPRDEQKGSTARAMLYFCIRYTDYSNFIDAQETLLKQWHTTYPPNATDIARNENIFNYQKNRNPFTDHPELIERMNVIGGTDTKPTIKEAKISQNTINYGSIVPSDQRTVYVINTGNINWSGIASATASDKIKVISTSSTAALGESVAITIGFTETADGTYTDNLKLDLQSQAGTSLDIPITYSIGQLSVNDLAAKKVIATFNPRSQLLYLLNVPSDATEVAIYNNAGQLVLLNSTFTDIPFAGHSLGVYFVVIKTKAEVFTSKFLVY